MSGRKPAARHATRSASEIKIARTGVPSVWTYNFPQGRVTDHRIGLTLYKIDSIMDGDLDELIDALVTADQAEKLQNSQDE